MRRLGIRLANAVLFVVCCYAAAGLFNEISSNALTSQDLSQGLAVAEVSKPAPPSATRTRDINKRNLFGSAVTSAVVDSEPEVEVVTTVTKLPLKLIATAAFESDSSQSRAAIIDREIRQTEVVGIGDWLESHPSVKIAGISQGEVILDNNGNREVLRIDDDDDEVKSRGRSARKPKRSTRSSRRSRDRSSRSSSRSSSTKASGNDSTLMENLKKLAEQTSRGGGLSDLLSQAQVLPKYEDGKMVGIELSAIASGSFYEQIGLENGAVISEVNGIKIDSPAVSQEIIAGLADMPEIFAVVDGVPFVVPAEKLNELLRSGSDRQ